MMRGSTKYGTIPKASFDPNIIYSYIRCEMTPTSAGGEQQDYISGGIQSPI